MANANNNLCNVNVASWLSLYPHSELMKKDARNAWNLNYFTARSLQTDEEQEETESITVLNMYPSERAETQLLLSIVVLAK